MPLNQTHSAPELHHMRKGQALAQLLRALSGVAGLPAVPAAVRDRADAERGPGSHGLPAAAGMPVLEAPAVAASVQACAWC